MYSDSGLKNFNANHAKNSLSYEDVIKVKKVFKFSREFFMPFEKKKGRKRKKEKRHIYRTPEIVKKSAKKKEEKRASGTRSKKHGRKSADVRKGFQRGANKENGGGEQSVTADITRGRRQL